MAGSAATRAGRDRADRRRPVTRGTTGAHTDQLGALLEAPRTLRFEDAAVPQPTGREVLIRLEGTGICGSDLAVWEGRPWMRYPLDPGAPGHEGWGIVEAVGPEVSMVAPGERVAALSYRAYARYDFAPEDALVVLPDGLDGPFPGEAVGCAMNVLARSGIERGQSVAIVGIGFLGALLVRLAVDCGATVLAISRRRFALRVAGEQGATATLPLDDPGVSSSVADLTNGNMCDVVIEAAGKQSTLDAASSLVKTRGRLVIAGYHQDGPRSVDMQSWNWRGLDVINAHEREDGVYIAGIAQGVTAVAEGRLDLRSLITHEFPLESLGEALDTAISRPDGFLKAVVRV